MSALAARTMRPAPSAVAVGGQECLFDPSGALYLPAEDTLLVADLHLEKGSAFARRGAMLPPYDTGSTLSRLDEVMDIYRPSRVVALGDSFHDRHGPDRLLPEDARLLDSLVAAASWTWIVGNHDPVLPSRLGGTIVGEATVGGLVVRHHPAVGAAGEVAGHLHPVAKVVLHGRGVRARAFLTDGRRCVLPAFGVYAGGLNACDRAFAALFPQGFTAHVIGRQRLFAIGRSVLCHD